MVGDRQLLMCLWSVGGLLLSVSGLKHCSPLQVRVMTTIDYERISGLWFVAGRQDVGAVDNQLWNPQINITIHRQDSDNLPVWFNHPRGCCVINMHYFGSDSMGRCQGRQYKWGTFRDDMPACFKHKLVGMAHYSLLYIVDTDYDDYAVIAHCRSKVLGLQLYCAHFNLLLLKRNLQAGSPDTVTTFDTTGVTAMLKESCTGTIQFQSTQSKDEACQQSIVNFYTPGVYEIASI